MTDAGTDASAKSDLNTHAARVHQGFAREDAELEADRSRRAELLTRFLAVMDDAGRPGLMRKFGSTVLQLTGQRPEYYWATKLTNDEGHEREVLVFDDGVHNWSDEITYSDRPRTPADEIDSTRLEEALTQILSEHGLSWPDEEGKS
jgi:hypothetical protein